MQAKCQIKTRLATESPSLKSYRRFIYRGRFTDLRNSFETAEEPDYVVEIAMMLMLVLQS